MLAAQAFDNAPSSWEVSLHRTPPDDADVVVAVGEEAQGDVRLDVAEPQRAVADTLSFLDAGSSLAIGVVGASGGCGTTSVALHLASMAPGQTCVVDLHPRPSCALRLGIDPADMTEAGVPVPARGGFRLTWGGPSFTAEDLGALRAGFRCVVLDAPAERAEALSDMCDRVVVVMAPTVGSATHAAELVCGMDDVPVALVSNRTGPGGETTRGELERIVGRRISLELPCSPGLRDAEDDGALVTSSWSPWLRGIARLSAALAS